MSDLVRGRSGPIRARMEAEKAPSEVLEREPEPDLKTKLEALSLEMERQGVDDSSGPGTPRRSSGLSKRYSQQIPAPLLEAVLREAAYSIPGNRPPGPKISRATLRRQRELDAAWDDIKREMIFMRERLGEVDPSKLPHRVRTAMNRGEASVVTSRYELLRWCAHSDIGIGTSPVARVLESAGYLHDEDFFTYEYLKEGVDPILAEGARVREMREERRRQRREEEEDDDWGEESDLESAMGKDALDRKDSAPLPSASGARELPRGVLRALSMSRAMASQVRSAAATPRGAVSSLSKQAVTAAAMGAFQSGLGRLGSGESAGGSGGRASDTGTQRGATGLGTVEERGGWGDSRGIWRSTESSGGGGSTTEDEGGLGRRGSVPGGGAPSSRGASRRSSYQTSMAPAGLKNYGMGTHQKSAVPDRHLWGSKEDYIVIRANAAMNNAVGHKVSKLAVVSENDLVRTREMFETLAGDKGGITQASFSAFLSEAMPDMVEQTRHVWNLMDRKGNGVCDFATVLGMLYPGATREEIRYMVQMANKRRGRGLCSRKLWEDMQKVFERKDKLDGGVLTMQPIVEAMVAMDWSAVTVEKILFKISEQRVVKAITFDDFERWFTCTVSANNLVLAYKRLSEAIEIVEDSEEEA